MKQENEDKKNSLFQMRESQEGINYTYNAMIVKSDETNEKHLKVLATSTRFVDNINICIPKTQSNT